MAKFYYNGILLPDIPTEHLATNPYIWIRKNQSSGYYDLVLGNDKWYYSSSGIYPANSDVIYWYQIPLDGYESYDEWVFNKESTGYFVVNTNRTVLWSNYSIPNDSATSTTLYYPKCERVIYTNEKLKFNDIKLPMLPTEHLSSNPYVFIRKNNTSGFYDLVLGASAWYYDSSNICVFPSGTDSSYWYKIPIVGSESYVEWEYYKSTTGYFGLDSERTLFWSLQDIPNGKNSSTIYFEATYPTPTITNTTKYLVRDSGKIYTVVDGALSEITGTLNADLFINSGADEIPSGTLLMTLSKPELLCWEDTEKDLPKLTATVTATPVGQYITKVIDLSNASIIGIKAVTVECTGTPWFSCSFDGGETWKEYSGGAWVDVVSYGMTEETIEAITSDEWNTAVSGIDSFVMRVLLQSSADSLINLSVNFLNKTT